MVTRMTVPGLFPPPDYAHAAVVEAGERLVFTAGAVPINAAGGLAGEGDFTAQTEQVLANLQEALHAASSDLSHVIASTVHVVSSQPEDLSLVWETIRASGLTDGPHTSTLLGVACLGYPGQLVEITAVATVPAEGTEG